MDRNEMFKLKLQMGINPSTQIEPRLLRAMWQQLTFESETAHCSRSSTPSQPVPVTTNQMDV